MKRIPHNHAGLRTTWSVRLYSNDPLSVLSVFGWTCCGFPLLILLLDLQYRLAVTLLLWLVLSTPTADKFHPVHVYNSQLMVSPNLRSPMHLPSVLSWSQLLLHGILEFVHSCNCLHVPHRSQSAQDSEMEQTMQIVVQWSHPRLPSVHEATDRISHLWIIVNSELIHALQIVW